MDTNILKTLKHPVSFIQHYGIVRNPIHGFVPFCLKKRQQELLNSFQNFDRNIVVHSRRMGITTTTMAYALWYAMFRIQKVVVLSDNNHRFSIEMLNIIRDMYNNLPENIRELNPLVINNKTSIMFDSGTKIMAVSSSPCSIRGTSIDLLILDNFAYGNNGQQELFEYALPALYASKIILISAGGDPTRNNMFTDFWDNHEHYKFKKHKVLWSDDTEDLLENKEAIMESISQEQWEMEYECKFYD